MTTSGNLSFWEKESFIEHTNYLIIGSGIVGLSTAIYLKQREKHKKVTVLERGILPSGASTKNAGFSCIGSPSEILSDLSKNSEEIVFGTVEKRWKGLVNLKALLGADNIGYQDFGSHELFEASSSATFDKSLNQLEYLNKHLQEITGLSTVFKENSKICADSGFKGFTRAISHAAEGQINTGEMMKCLIQLAQSLGIIILNGVEVHEIQKSEINTNLGRIPFEKLAVCTNGFSKKFFPQIDVKPARAQVIVTTEIPNLKLKGIFHFDEGFYYFRNIGNRILFGGGRNLDLSGEETESMQTSPKILAHLQEILTYKIVPYASFNIEHEWAGTMGVGEQKKPIIEQVDDHIFCGIRLGGMGVAIGSLIGKELAALMVEN